MPPQVFPNSRAYYNIVGTGHLLTKWMDEHLRQSESLKEFVETENGQEVLAGKQRDWKGLDFNPARLVIC